MKRDSHLSIVEEVNSESISMELQRNPSRDASPQNLSEQISQEKRGA